MKEKKTIWLCLGTSISFQINDFNYEIMTVEFENDKVWEIILKFSSLNHFDNNCGFESNPNLKF